MGLILDTATSGTRTGDFVNVNNTVSYSNSFMLGFCSNTVGNDMSLGTVTYNSVTMTYLTSLVVSSNRAIACWYLANPDTGNNVASFAFSSNFDKCGAVVTYRYGAPTNPDSYSSDRNASSSTMTLSTTVVDPSSWLVAGWCMGSGSTPSTGTTQLIDQADGGTGSHLYLGHSNGEVGSGSHSLEYTNGSAMEWTGIIVSLAPFVPASQNGAYSGGGSFMF